MNVLNKITIINILTKMTKITVILKTKSYTY
jgi:hypothetical protein